MIANLAGIGHHASDKCCGFGWRIVMLADGRYVQHDAGGGWHVHWCPVDDAFDPLGPVPYLWEGQRP
jgi:hypothetical protein